MKVQSCRESAALENEFGEPTTFQGARPLSEFYKFLEFSRTKNAAESYSRSNGGGGSGIRTHDTVSRIHAFQASALSHSAIPPQRERRADQYNGSPPADKQVTPMSGSVQSTIRTAPTSLTSYRHRPRAQGHLVQGDQAGYRGGAQHRAGRGTLSCSPTAAAGFHSRTKPGSASRSRTTTGCSTNMESSWSIPRAIRT